MKNTSAAAAAPVMDDRSSAIVGSDTGVRNAMTIDVEDYFQVSAFESSVDRSSWAAMTSRVERNTRQILRIFSDHDVTATFFVLGWVAERYPGLVREIHDLGHEVACHGFSHRLIYDQTPEDFRAESEHAKKLLEDIVGEAVHGYRAASYSITDRSLWALDVLGELGFSYDSSIFPVRHDRYGLIGGPEGPHRVKTSGGASLVEFPLTQVRIGPLRVPAAGGGYFRLYPYWLSKLLFGTASRRGLFVFYLHPWEIDVDQPRVEAGRLSTFRHYNNIERCEARLNQLLSEFEFCPLGQLWQVLEHADDFDWPTHRYG